MAKKLSKLKLHKSFCRSYREDYQRKLEVPGLLHHAIDAFRLIFKNWKLFGGLLLLVASLNVILVGIMNEDTYVSYRQSLEEYAEESDNQIGNFAKASLLLLSTITTGGLAGGEDEVQQIFLVIIFLIIWLVSVFIARHLLAKRQLKLRDALYNALAPALSTFVIIAVIFIQLIPIFLLIIAYASALETDFLTMPFYALLFFIFAMLMIILSGYLLSSSIIALVAVTAPGLYPIKALATASELMAGRRMKFIIRLIYLFFVLAVVIVVCMLPIILLDFWLKGTFEWLVGLPIVPFFLLTVTCFAFMYSAVYLYLYYRRMLDYDDKH